MRALPESRNVVGKALAPLITRKKHQMNKLLTPLAIGLNVAGLAGLWLANGEPLSEFAPVSFAIVATVSVVALVAKVAK